MQKEGIKEIILRDDQTIPAIFTECVLPASNDENQAKSFLFSIKELQEIVCKPQIKVQFYHYQILVLFLIATKKEESDPIESEIFNEVLLYFRLALPIVASISESGMEEFMTDIESYASKKYPETLTKLEIEVGYAPGDAPLLDAKQGEQKRKHYGNALQIEKKNEVRPMIRGDYGALRHSLSKDLIEAPKMVKLRIKKTHTHEKMKAH